MTESQVKLRSSSMRNSDLLGARTNVVLRPSTLGERQLCSNVLNIWTYPSLRAQRDQSTGRTGQPPELAGQSQTREEGFCLLGGPAAPIRRHAIRIPKSSELPLLL